MTPSDVTTYARQQYNAVNDSFFSEPELYKHIWHAQDILSKEAQAIENTYSTPTVANQQEYTFPTNTIAIKRITYNGQRLRKVKIKDDDVLTGFNADTTARGRPTFYYIFDRVVYLRPVPDAVYTLKLFTFDRPQEVVATIDVAEEFHLDLVNYVLWRMALKDQNFQAAAEYKSQWDEAILRCKKWSQRRQFADGFNVVRDEDAETSIMEVF